MIGLAAGLLWSAIKRGLRAAARHPWAVLVAIGGALVALLTYRARRAERQRDAATRARADAEATTAATTETLERRDEGAHTQRKVIDAARTEAAAHPDDPVAPARAARDYARDRYDRVPHAADPHPRGADPVHHDPAAEAARRGRGG